MWGRWKTCCATNWRTAECLKFVPFDCCKRRTCFNWDAKREVVGGGGFQDCVALVGMCMRGAFLGGILDCLDTLCFDILDDFGIAVY